MSSDELTNYLAKLIIIREGLFKADNQLHTLAKEHKKLTVELTGFERPDERKEQRLSQISIETGICLDAIITELFNLSEIRKKFLNDLQITKIQQILTALKPVSDVLDNNDRLLRELRNNVISHGEIFGDQFRGLTDIFSIQSDPWKRIFLSAKCGSMFTSGLIENLVSETVHAKLIIRDHMDVTDAHTSDYFTSLMKAREIRDNAVTNLLAARLNREISFAGYDGL